MSSKLFIGDKDAVKSVSGYGTVELEGWMDTMRTRVDRADASHSAWFNAVIRRRAEGARSIPVDISRNGQAVEELPLDFDVERFVYRASLALDRYGAFYAAVVTQRGGMPLDIVWLDPTTIEIVTDDKTGQLVGFARKIGERDSQRWAYDATTRKAYAEGRSGTAGAGNLVWAWSPGTNEIGPGDVLADDARLPAQTLYGADLVMRELYARGTIANYLVQADIMPSKADRDRIIDKIRRALGRGASTSHNIEVLQSGLTFTKIGTDPKDLDIGSIRADLRDDICGLAATPRMLVIPSDASNRSTIDRATQSWLRETIEPHVSLILQALNFHVFEPMGYKLTANLTSMEVDQEEEASKAAAWATYVDRNVPAETAAAMLGIDVPEGHSLQGVQAMERPELEAKSTKAVSDDYAAEVAAALELWARGDIDNRELRQAWKALAAGAVEDAFRAGAGIGNATLLPHEQAAIDGKLVAEYAAIDQNVDRLEDARRTAG